MISIGEWRALGEYKSVRGHQIFYIDTSGIGKETLLLIHGFPTSSWDFQKIWPALTARYRVVAMDMLGFGHSDKPDPHRYSIHEQADIVEALITEIGLSAFHVLAHDYGDTVAQELLARQSEGTGAGKWQSVCLLNGGLFPETHKALLIQKLLLSPLGPLVNRLTTRRSFDASVSRVFGAQTKPSQADLDGFWALINHNNGRHIFHNLITYMRDRRAHRERWIAALKNANIPIGLINGSVDPVSGAHMITHYHKIVGAPDFLLQLPEIGHYPQTESPDEVIAGYFEFQSGL